MNEQNLQLMRQSFPVMFQHKAEISRLFYQTLFRDAPETEAMFGDSMGTQREMLATVLTTLAKASFKPDTVSGILDRLARAHAGLGLNERQFKVGEDALIGAISTVMSGQITDEVMAAWHAAVRRVIDAMQNPPDG